MAFMEKEIIVLKGILLLVLLTAPLISTTNIDCNGKAFHCVNSTHFMICVDLGTGVSTTIDDVSLPCPVTTVCKESNRFECEFPEPTTSTPEIATFASVETTPSQVTTLSTTGVTTIPFEEYYNTISTTTLSEFKQTLSTSYDISTVTSTTDARSNINYMKTENISILDETTVSRNDFTQHQTTTETVITNDIVDIRLQNVIPDEVNTENMNNQDIYSTVETSTESVTLASFLSADNEITGTDQTITTQELIHKINQINLKNATIAEIYSTISDVITTYEPTVPNTTYLETIPGNTVESIDEIPTMQTTANTFVGSSIQENSNIFNNTTSAIYRDNVEMTTRFETGSTLDNSHSVDAIMNTEPTEMIMDITMASESSTVTVEGLETEQTGTLIISDKIYSTTAASISSAIEYDTETITSETLHASENSNNKEYFLVTANYNVSFTPTTETVIASLTDTQTPLENISITSSDSTTEIYSEKITTQSPYFYETTSSSDYFLTGTNPNVTIEFTKSIDFELGSHLQTDVTTDIVSNPTAATIASNITFLNISYKTTIDFGEEYHNKPFTTNREVESQGIEPTIRSTTNKISENSTPINVGVTADSSLIKASEKTTIEDMAPTLATISSTTNVGSTRSGSNIKNHTHLTSIKDYESITEHTANIPQDDIENIDSEVFNTVFEKSNHSVHNEKVLSTDYNIYNTVSTKNYFVRSSDTTDSIIVSTETATLDNSVTNTNIRSVLEEVPTAISDVVDRPTDDVIDKTILQIDIVTESESVKLTSPLLSSITSIDTSTTDISIKSETDNILNTKSSSEGKFVKTDSNTEVANVVSTTMSNSISSSPDSLPIPKQQKETKTFDEVATLSHVLPTENILFVTNSIPIETSTAPPRTEDMNLNQKNDVLLKIYNNSTISENKTKLNLSDSTQTTETISTLEDYSQSTSIDTTISTDNNFVISTTTDIGDILKSITQTLEGSSTKSDIIPSTLYYTDTKMFTLDSRTTQDYYKSNFDVDQYQSEGTTAINDGDILTQSTIASQTTGNVVMQSSTLSPIINFSTDNNVVKETYDLNNNTEEVKVTEYTYLNYEHAISSTPIGSEIATSWSNGPKQISTEDSENQDITNPLKDLLLNTSNAKINDKEYLTRNADFNSENFTPEDKYLETTSSYDFITKTEASLIQNNENSLTNQAQVTPYFNNEGDNSPTESTIVYEEFILATTSLNKDLNNQPRRPLLVSSTASLNDEPIKEFIDIITPPFDHVINTVNSNNNNHFLTTPSGIELQTSTFTTQSYMQSSTLDTQNIYLVSGHKLQTNNDILLVENQQLTTENLRLDSSSLLTQEIENVTARTTKSILFNNGLASVDASLLDDTRTSSFSELITFDVSNTTQSSTPDIAIYGKEETQETSMPVIHSTMGFGDIDNLKLLETIQETQRTKNFKKTTAAVDVIKETTLSDKFVHVTAATTSPTISQKTDKQVESNVQNVDSTQPVQSSELRFEEIGGIVPDTGVLVHDMQSEKTHSGIISLVTTLSKSVDPNSDSINNKGHVDEELRVATNVNNELNNVTKEEASPLPLQVKHKSNEKLPFKSNNKDIESINNSNRGKDMIKDNKITKAVHSEHLTYKPIENSTTSDYPTASETYNINKTPYTYSTTVIPNVPSRPQLFSETTTKVESDGHITDHLAFESSTPTTILSFQCKQKRGRYADKQNCNKFYICLGNGQIIQGTCPVHTVFSEIRKQCTKNLSHCIRNNQFQCVTEGRFSDFLNDNVYYICVKNNVSSFIRYKLMCQNGYHLNKTVIRCELNIQTEQSSISNSKDYSDQSGSSAKQETTEKPKKFKCEKEGKFPDPTNCRRYFDCTKTEKHEYRLKRKKCDSEEIFHRDKKKCVDAESNECN